MAPKGELSFSGSHTLLQTWQIIWKKWMSVEKSAESGTFAALYCTIFRTQSFCKSLKFFRTSNVSLDPETVQLSVFYILSAMFTGACGPSEKLSLALVRCHVQMLCAWLWNRLIIYNTTNVHLQSDLLAAGRFWCWISCDKNWRDLLNLVLEVPWPAHCSHPPCHTTLWLEYPLV